MTGVVVTGWSALSSAGVGGSALVRRLAGTDPAAATAALRADPGPDLAGLYEEPLPSPRGHALTDFDVRAHLGRKGTGSFDRATALAVTCCQDAVRDAGIVIDDATRSRIGVAIGTSVGSFKSTSDFTRETLVQEKPYLVNPMLFPNTVMNCAAGQVAIRFGLRGVNATIAGGALAFLNVLRYAGTVIERGYADVMLAGAVEEFSPHRAWASHLTGTTASVAGGEAAGVFLLAGPEAPAWAGAGRAAEILAVTAGYGPGGADRAEQALAGCVSRAVYRAGVDPARIGTVLTGEAEAADRREYGPVGLALGHEPRRVMVKRLFGECDAASGALALATLLATRTDVAGHGDTEHNDTADNTLSLITGRGPDGAVGAAVVRVRGSAGGGPDRE